ncbi:MAG: class I SAM-dependent methyltransferase [Alphaproteobacteria bacterium]|nr:class I SAM-dependent methyltransferase [Alphaproteobacteria bacterium]
MADPSGHGAVVSPIAATAYYCCGVRARDAASPRPICNDHLAQRFMDAEAEAIFAPFAGLRAPNGSNIVRHRLVDDILRARLAEHRNLRVVLLGCGFDTRAFRLTGGTWLEFDEPALLARKEAVLPAAEAPNALCRLATDFSPADLAAQLRAHADGGPAVVVMEGVSMYLAAAQLQGSLATLRAALAGHTLLCDLMTRRFARRFGGALLARIRALGGAFGELSDEPAASVTTAGYRLLGRQSIPGAAVAQGAVPIPRWLLATLLRSLRDGYQLYRFEALP